MSNISFCKILRKSNLIFRYLSERNIYWNFRYFPPLKFPGVRLSNISSCEILPITTQRSSAVPRWKFQKENLGPQGARDKHDDVTFSNKYKHDKTFHYFTTSIAQHPLQMLEQFELTGKNRKLIVTAKVYLTLGSYAIVVMVMVILNWVIYGKLVR